MVDAVERLSSASAVSGAQEEDSMKALVGTWRRRRRTRMLVFRFDRPRRIDRLIDYFGERLVTVLVPDRGRETRQTAG